jgi:hypothetical protein
MRWIAGFLIALFALSALLDVGFTIARAQIGRGDDLAPLERTTRQHGPAFQVVEEPF